MIEELAGKVFDHKLPIVFVGGPYSQPDPCINVNATAKLLDRLWFDGLVFPVCPMIESHMQHLLIPRPYEAWLLRCMRFIRFVDAGIFRPGVSSGKAREQGLFKARNIPYFEEADENLSVTALYLWVDEIWNKKG